MSDLSIGSDWDIINAPVTITYEEVTYTRPIRGFRIKARGEGNVFHKRKDADTKYCTIKGGTAEPFTVWLSQATSSLGFFATESGTETLEAYVFF